MSACPRANAASMARANAGARSMYSCEAERKGCASPDTVRYPDVDITDASARGDIHRDFEAEAQIGEGRRRPLHVHLLDDVRVRSRTVSQSDVENASSVPSLTNVHVHALGFQFYFDDARPMWSRCASSAQGCIEVEHRMEQLIAPSLNMRASFDRSYCGKPPMHARPPIHCRDDARARRRSPMP